jgi:serine/threonine-protein kinase
VNPSVWRKAEELFHAALDLPADKRSGFLDQSCAGDPELRREVENLLAKEMEAASFLERPVLAPKSLSGRQFGSYRIISRLGAGGMGEVYRAHDDKLGRDVAIKILPEEFARDWDRLSRFRREARTLAALNHPNIGAIYGLEEFGDLDCLVLELVEGEDLRGPLAIDRALDCARQLAEALQAAHEKGIVHRDLKPANIKVTPQGRVKVLDFGLAKALSGSTHEKVSAATEGPTETLSGIVLGTPGYMSPEQARGQIVDRRADLWAFGCVLFELLCGERAFPGSSAADSFAAILTRDPSWDRLPPCTPAKIRELVRQCLDKDPERRISEISKAIEIIAEAQRAPGIGKAESVISPQPEPPKPRRWPWKLGIVAAGIIALLAIAVMIRSPKHPAGKIMLAVLPFANLSGDPGQEFFADGMTEEMIAELGSLDPTHLGVIARTSAMQYKGAQKSGTRIAGELSVQYLLEGSVRRANGRVRITAQLIQASDQTHLWAEDFDRDPGDILEVQAGVARAIAAQIRLALSNQTEARLARSSHVDPQAHEDYLQGLYGWNQRSSEGTARAIESFQRAIARDPGYAAAYSGLARVYMLASLFGMSQAEGENKARELATRALELDPSLAEAHATLGFVKGHTDYDWEGARREFQRAIDLDPADPNNHLFYSNGYLSPLGRHREAIEEMKKAIEMDPLSLPIQSFMGRTYEYARDYNAALAQLLKAGAMDPNFAINHVRLARVYEYTGRLDQAIPEYSRARAASGEDPKSILHKETLLRQALAARGPRGYWEAMLELSSTGPNPPEAHVGPHGLALIYANLGRLDEALTVLEQACANHSCRAELKIDPAYQPLYSDPRFSALLRQVHLAP